MGFNSRPSCDGRPTVELGIQLNPDVSIHARRVTGDLIPKADIDRLFVSIHARRVTGDSCKRKVKPAWLFQFTPVV